MGRLVGHLDVMAHDEGHPCHVVVVGGHDPREGELVPGRRLGDDQTADVPLDGPHA